MFINLDPVSEVWCDQAETYTILRNGFCRLCGQTHEPVNWCSHEEYDWGDKDGTL
jgi:hypothetical protein